MRCRAAFFLCSEGAAASLAICNPSLRNLEHFRYYLGYAARIVGRRGSGNKERLRCGANSLRPRPLSLSLSAWRCRRPALWRLGTAAERGPFSTETKASIVAALGAATSVARECAAASEAIAVFPVISDMEDTVSVSAVMALANMNMTATEVINDGGYCPDRSSPLFIMRPGSSKLCAGQKENVANPLHLAGQIPSAPRARATARVR